VIDPACNYFHTCLLSSSFFTSQLFARFTQSKCLTITNSLFFYSKKTKKRVSLVYMWRLKNTFCCHFARKKNTSWIPHNTDVTQAWIICVYTRTTMVQKTKSLFFAGISFNSVPSAQPTQWQWLPPFLLTFFSSMYSRLRPRPYWLAGGWRGAKIAWASLLSLLPWCIYHM